jgi:hypothetical protein
LDLVLILSRAYSEGIMMKHTWKRILPVMLVTSAVLCGPIAIRAGDSEVAYPTGYRGWTFLHTSMVAPTISNSKKKPCEKPCIGGLFHFYANEKALQGLRSGSYPDGAIIAEELLELLSDQNGGGKEGPRRLVAVMVKDSARYSSTGGWGFGSFEDASSPNRLDTAAQTACFGCHMARKDKSYVFAEYHER